MVTGEPVLEVDAARTAQLLLVEVDLSYRQYNPDPIFPNFKRRPDIWQDPCR